jgi:hypothetical protein
MLKPHASLSAIAFLLLSFLIFSPSISQAETPPIAYKSDSETWHAPGDLGDALKAASKKSNRTLIHNLGQSPGAHDLLLLEIAPEGEKPKGKSATGPAVLVVGNTLGETPLGTEGALALIRFVLSDQADPATGNVRWYIMPNANPDAADRFFQNPIIGGGRNATPVDDDKDGDFGEDGYEDLNNDGIISQMLMADPEGAWILTDDAPAFARKANPARGETGLYRLLSEGFDNDGDGLWNEDGPGGVICGQNFPHRFEHWTTTGGLWPGDQPESRAILDFMFSHPDIAMVIVMDSHDSLMGDDGKKVSEEKVSFRPYMAEQLDVSPSQEFTMAKAVKMLQSITGDASMDEVKARYYLGGKARTEPHAQDVPWLRQLGDDYRLAVFDTLTPAKPADESKVGPGAFGEWAYFQFGVPAFAINFWQLPAAAEAAADSNAKDDKIAETCPVTEALLEYMATNPETMAANAWPGYLPWSATRLPDGREVLVGGETPFSRTTPPAAWVDSLLAVKIPFLASLPNHLPLLGIQDVTMTARGSDVFELTAWIANEGDLDYPIGQGTLCRRVPPVVVNISGGKILEGRNRTKVEKLPGHQSVPVRWLVYAQPGSSIEISAEAPSLGRQSKSITVTTQGGQR